MMNIVKEMILNITTSSADADKPARRV